MHRRDSSGALQLLTDVRNPARLVVLGFAAAVLVGTILLALPVASASGDGTPLFSALFTAVSAVCVTGLIVLDIPVHFSLFGEIVIMVLIQIGGTGVMTLATLIGLLVNHRIGMRMQATAQAETKSLGAGEVRNLVGRIFLLSLSIEAVIAVFLLFGFARDPHIDSFGDAVYASIFHSISAFNNAGFSIFSQNMMNFVGNGWICIPLMVAVILGGIGFPVLIEIERRVRHQKRRFSLHTMITLWTTGVLLVVGPVGMLLAEWGNPATLGGLSGADRILAATFSGVVPRTAGFNSLDLTEFRSETLLLNDILMLIGGGSAGTAGGIKVTTFALLAFVVWAELRGEPTVHVWGRRLPVGVIRQALAIVLLAVGLITTSSLAILAMTDLSFDVVLFEVISAFATVGLSAGITATLPVAGQLILIMLMFVGRLGPITLGSALALREGRRRYELPMERPIVG
jgi:potassium uptake TrkH family protein